MPHPWALRALCGAALAVVGCAIAHAQSPPAQEGAQEQSPGELERLRARVEALERDRDASRQPESPRSVDLSDAQYSSIDAAPARGTDARPWYENVRISGYGAFGYYDSGGAGGVRHGSFLVKDASLFVEAQVWEKVSFFYEAWITHYLFDGGAGFDDGELYVRFSDLLGTEETARIGVKAGRIDVPFGEDYLRMDAIDDPLISLSAADPWAIDEGAEVYGRSGALHWVLAVTNGNIASGGDDSHSKLWCGKLFGDVCPDLYLSGSVLNAGDTGVSTIWFGRGLITPVGLFGGSAAGTSPSSQVSSTLWEADARLGESRRCSLGLQVGGAMIDDDVGAFDRTLVWLEVEPAVHFTPRLSAHVRYSQIGTDDADEGYLLQGDIFGAGDELGYDTHRMQRLACGLSWVLDPHARIKLEVGHDWYDVIPGSSFDAANDERLYWAIETVASF